MRHNRGINSRRNEGYDTCMTNWYTLHSTGTGLLKHIYNTLCMKRVYQLYIRGQKRRYMVPSRKLCFFKGTSLDIKLLGFLIEPIWQVCHQNIYIWITVQNIILCGRPQYTPRGLQGG